MLSWFVIAFSKGLMKRFMKNKQEEDNMILPTEVWVMGHKWDIHRADKSWFDDHGTWGDCCSQQRKIRIYLGGGGSIARDTLLHEILHACWHILNFENKEEEENVVSSLSSVLIGVVDDPRNEPVVKFILGGK